MEETACFHPGAPSGGSRHRPRASILDLLWQATPREDGEPFAQLRTLPQRLIEAGIQAIPAVGFVDARDAAFVGNWVARYGLRSIFVDLQSAGAPKSRDHVRESLPALIARATSLDRIVINGVAQPDRVIELARLTEPLELVLTNGNAFQLARSGHDYFWVDRRLRKLQTTAPRTQVFNALFDFYGAAAMRRIEGYVASSAQLRLPLGNTSSAPAGGCRGVSDGELAPQQAAWPLGRID